MPRHKAPATEDLADEVIRQWEDLTLEPNPFGFGTLDCRRWTNTFGPRTKRPCYAESWSGVVLYRIWDDASQSNPLNNKEARGIFFITHKAKPYPGLDLRTTEGRTNALRNHMDWKSSADASPFISTTTDVNWIYGEGLRRAMEGIRGTIRVTALSARIRAEYGLPILDAEQSAVRHKFRRSEWEDGNIGWDADDDVLLPIAVLEAEVLGTKRWEEIHHQHRFERWIQWVDDTVWIREQQVLRKLYGQEMGCVAGKK